MHAKELIDTTSTVVDRLLDHYERDRQRPAPKAENGHAAMLRFDPAALPSLTHTKLRKAVLDGRDFRAPTGMKLPASPSKPASEGWGVTSSWS